MFVLFSIATLACTTPKKNVAGTQNFQEKNPVVLSKHANLREALWKKAIESAIQLERDVEQFLLQPTPDSLALARNSWRQARDDYSPTEVFRFQNGPIDHAENGVEGFLNAWPLDEGFIDYTVDDANS